MRQRRVARAIATAACCGRPIDPDAASGQADQILKGRGLVSGEKGALEVGF